MDSQLSSDLREKMNPSGSIVDRQPVGDSDMERSSIHDCRVVRVESTNIVTHWSDERDHVHSVGSDAVILLNGHACALADVRSGSVIRLTTKPGDSKAVSRIESSTVSGRQFRCA